MQYPVKFSFLSAALFVTCALLSANQAHAELIMVKGAGATLPAKAYASWAQPYANKTNIIINYTGTGSGDGIKKISAQAVDFGASDVPLSDKELTEKKLLQFPTMVAGIVPVVNLNGISSNSLRLNGEVLALIFKESITEWNDARIAKLNPGLRLPATPIVRIVRKDSSGSTEVFGHYLQASHPDFDIKPAKKMTWPGNVLQGEGSDGVVNLLQQTTGGISYVSYDRVLKGGIAAVSLQNPLGMWVKASEDSIGAASRSPKFRHDMDANLLNVENSLAWPIVTPTYVLMSTQPKNGAGAGAAASYFLWAFQQGDRLIKGSGFVPLPAEVQAKAVRKLTSIKPVDGALQIRVASLP